MTSKLIMVQPENVKAVARANAIESDHAPKEILRDLESRVSKTVTKAQAIEANCSTRFHAAHSSGRRPLSVLKWVVLHSTEGPSAISAASWFENPGSAGSSNLVVDDGICYRTLPDEEIPWGAQGANYEGFHIEQTGYAKWLTVVWSRKHRNTIKRAAYKAALRCKWYNIPIRFVKADGLRRGDKGITTHAECTKAFGGNHTDPGSGYPMYLFLQLTKWYFNRLPSGV